MDVSRQTLEQVYSDIVNSVGYRTTVGPVDKRKVSERLAGKATKLPSARLARAAWRVAALLTPLVPPTEPPDPIPPKRLAAQTYNKGSRGQNARYCTAESGNPDSGGFRYNADGLCEGGRSEQFVPGLKPADEMDGRGPCDPYDGFPPWPEKSYEV